MEFHFLSYMVMTLVRSLKVRIRLAQEHAELQKQRQPDESSAGRSQLEKSIRIID